ncbi:hypothetical protein HZB94_01805 [Candidatus Falkowbacteria bacterium]|nr:hypothetical protein [Candidatus Falkowbacteria bacterium]
MSKKCVNCGAPIEGFWAKISAVAGVKQSAKNPDYCNKCEGMSVSQPVTLSTEPNASQPQESQAAPEKADPPSSV